MPDLRTLTISSLPSPVSFFGGGMIVSYILAHLLGLPWLFRLFYAHRFDLEFQAMIRNKLSFFNLDGRVSNPLMKFANRR